MSKVNRGVQFEKMIADGFSNVPNTIVIRLKDPQNGYAGNNNPCDYIVYREPILYCIECKSTYGNTLSISSNNVRHHHGNISDFQWDSLLNYSTYSGVISGYMIWFIDHDKTIFVPATYLKKLYSQGKKSLNIRLDCDTNECFEIEGKKKRILFEYNMKDFMENYGNFNI